jgi:phosphate-selective porin
VTTKSYRLLVVAAFLPTLLWGAASDTTHVVHKDAETDSTSAIQIEYGDKGWEFSTKDGKYRLQIQSRLQFRYAYPFDTDPVTFDDFSIGDQHIVKVNRARLKIGGNAFARWLGYYWEYELAAGNLLDFRIMLEKFPFLRLKVGQWKVEYNRERVISSGKQQLADRSLINRPFTIDRQQGVELYGRFGLSTLADFSYWAGVFMGTGRGAAANDDEEMMFTGRLQWNVLGREVPWHGSDLEHHEKPVALISLGGVTNQSPYTRFSQGGGGQLEGFDQGSPGQYRVKQYMVETALMVKGLSWQQEFHWKEINDRKNGTITTLIGNYVQIGYFFHYWLQWIPQPLEIAVRYDVYDPDMRLEGLLQRELSLAGNWFFKDHLNKLTAEFSHINFQENLGSQRDGWRFRLQWDVSL